MSDQRLQYDTDRTINGNISTANKKTPATLCGTAWTKTQSPCHANHPTPSVIRRGLALLVVMLVSCLAMAARPTGQQRTILIIDSYNENAPWAKGILTPLSYYIAQSDTVHAEILYLNSVLITDSIEYAKVKDNMVSAYASRQIDYVVYIGNMAFTLREVVKQMWGDIPTLLVTRDMSLAPEEYYYSGYDKPLLPIEGPDIDTLRPEYNFTAIHAPDLYRETVDMMIDIIPDMEELVLFTDATYFNRNLARNVENYLLAEFPEIRFKWAQASQDSPELQYYLTTRSPRSGLLLSNWFYSQINALGYPQLVSGDINLLYGAVNPFFTLKRGYVNLGAVGGVFVDQQRIYDTLSEYLGLMLAGQDMRDIKIATFPHYKIPLIRYPAIAEYKLNTQHMPEDTVYMDKPESLWQRYFWMGLLVLILVGAIVLMFLRRNVNQRRKIELLSRHKQFVDNMPIPYTKAKVVYNDDMSAILDVRYTMSNQAFDEIIRANSNPQVSYLLFSPEFISDKTAEMLETGAPVSFMHRFEKSDKYYIFTLCLVDTQRKRSSRDVVDMIDIFAIDITERQKAEDELKLITRRLDLTIDVADLIPWDWDMQTDTMTFDAYSLFQRQKLTTIDNGYLNSNHSVVTVAEFMKLIHPEDREVLRAVRENLFLDKIKKFTIEYRVIIARQNQQCIEWVEVKGAIARRDEEGRPAYVMGSMTLITDRKKQQQTVIDAERRSAEAQAIKERFMTDISHEVRSQLNSIVGFATLMSDTDDPAKRKEFAHIIQTNNNELLKYIDDIAGEQSVDTIDNSEHQSGAYTVETENEEVRLGSDIVLNDEAPHVVRPSSSTVIPPRPKTPQPQPEAEHERPTRKQGPLILVAEDIEGNYLLLKHFIPKQYEVVHAWTGAEALDMFKERRPDLVLMDIGMPVMDGYKATAEIRKFDTEVPIVAVTAYTFASERDLIMSSGFDDYLSKPVSRELILDALNRYVPL